MSFAPPCPAFLARFGSLGRGQRRFSMSNADELTGCAMPNIWRNVSNSVPTGRS
jgi:hypothetical protein